MNLLNILIVLTTLIKFNECNDIEDIIKDLAQQWSRRVTQFKEELEKDMGNGLSRLEKDLDRANKNNAEINLKFNQTINEMDTNMKWIPKQAGRVHILFKL